jgi:hypothetical protein
LFPPLFLFICGEGVGLFFPAFYSVGQKFAVWLRNSIRAMPLPRHISWGVGYGWGKQDSKTIGNKQ